MTATSIRRTRFTPTASGKVSKAFFFPYRVHRIVTSADAAGWRPTKGELDRFGREIPDEEYLTKDFERIVVICAHGPRPLPAICSDFMQEDGTEWRRRLVFCVDQEHALGDAEGIADSAFHPSIRSGPRNIRTMSAG